MEWVVSLALGLGLAAACGFRVFVPLLAVSAAAAAGLVELGEGFAWLGSPAALLAFAAATVVEVAAYHIPWLDNLLDSVATPAAVIAGVLIMASTLPAADPLLRWTLAVIAGGGLAASVQTSTVVLRQASSLFSAGLANPLLAAVEAGAALILAVVAILLPLLAAVLALGIVFVLLGARRRRRTPAVSV